MERKYKKISQNEIAQALLEQDSRKIRLSTIKTEYKKLINRMFTKLGKETKLIKGEREKVN